MSGPVPASAPGEAPGTAAAGTPRAPLAGFVERKRKGVQRAKYWSPDVENGETLGVGGCFGVCVCVCVCVWCL